MSRNFVDNFSYNLPPSYLESSFVSQMYKVPKVESNQRLKVTKGWKSQPKNVPTLYTSPGITHYKPHDTLVSSAQPRHSGLCARTVPLVFTNQEQSEAGRGADKCN